jgi:hypothetical protein
MSYLEDILNSAPASKQWLATRFDGIRLAPDGASRWLKDLGKNDLEHAVAVEEYIGKILLEAKVVVSPEEAYLLLHSIYTHDVGYRKEAKSHARHSHDLILRDPASFFINDTQLAKAIALVVLCHGQDDLTGIPSAFAVDFLSKTTEFDLRFLGALLLMADEMDQGYLRVFNRTGHEDGPRSKVYHIEIGPQIVKVKTSPATEREWQELKGIVERVQARLDSVAGVLRSRGIKLEQVSLYPTGWAEEGRHKDRLERIDAKKVATNHSSRKVLFLLDRTVLGAEILQRVQVLSPDLTVLPVSSAVGAPVSLSEATFDCVVLLLGEDFEIGLHASAVNIILENTRQGGGLLAFPFVAWSSAQGINDTLQECIPVELNGRWWEGREHMVTSLKPHPITDHVQPFQIENTYERLRVKPSADCLVRDSEGEPVVVVGTFGKGRVAYLNFCSHLCQEQRIMRSPCQQSPAVGTIVTNAMSWVCSR